MKKYGFCKNQNWLLMDVSKISWETVVRSFAYDVSVGPLLRQLQYFRHDPIGIRKHDV